MKEEPPAGAGQGRRAVNLKCENCLFNSTNFQGYQARCRLVFLQALIDRIYPAFERSLSLQLDSAWQEVEAQGRRRGGPVHVGGVVRRIMADLARRRIDPGYLGEQHGG